MPNSPVLDGISAVEMACSFRIRVDRMMLSWNTFAAYMDIANQVVPQHATIQFVDVGDSIVLTFVWAETRTAEYRVEDGRVGEKALEAPETVPEPKEEQPRPLKRTIAGMPRR